MGLHCSYIKVFHSGDKAQEILYLYDQYLMTRASNSTLNGEKVSKKNQKFQQEKNDGSADG